jgi:periplasmic protein TonB
VSNTIVTIETKPWLRSQRAASLLRLVVVVAVHGAVIAALLSWSWPPAPIEVSILSLEDLGGEVSSSEEVPAQKLPAQEHAASDAQAATSPEILPAAVAPALELAQPQQIDIALSQLVPPAPESQVAPELAPEQLPEAQVQPAQTSDTAPTALTAPITPPVAIAPTTSPRPTSSTSSTSSTTPTSSASSTSSASASTPVPSKAPAAETVRPTPDLDASARPRSVAKVMAPNGGATATPNSASIGNTGLTGNASGSAQPGTGTEPALTAARFDADYLHNPAPAYPAQSRRLKEEGTVLLLVRVSVEGTPLSVEIRNSSGFERLDEAGLQAVRQWRFVPAKRGSENVAASVLVPIQFRRQ